MYISLAVKVYMRSVKIVRKLHVVSDVNEKGDGKHYFVTTRHTDICNSDKLCDR